jgi:hypothetical protein
MKEINISKVLRQRFISFAGVSSYQTEENTDFLVKVSIISLTQHLLQRYSVASKMRDAAREDAENYYQIGYFLSLI